ncbi:MAG: hypothetical protein K2Q21_06815 [Chitinophagaceae bacterium]|nr:hypothetical protein [Chitinophagaceae bacterium]
MNPLLFISFFISFLALGQIKEEFLDYKTSKVNGSIPNALTKADLLRVLGKPTKIEIFEGECGLTEEQEKAKVRNWYYYDSTKFLLFDNEAQISEVNFRSGKFTYTTAKIKLSNKTTFQDLQKVYPVSTKAAIKENNGNMVRLSPCSDCDGYCFLYFEKGKLVKLEWWEPC